MLFYLIQLLVFQALFLLVYELFLKKETFFSLNRAYLLVTPFLAAIIPLLEFEILQNAVPENGIVQLPVLMISESNLLSDNTLNQTENPFSLLDFMRTNWMSITYFTGLALSLVLFLRKYFQIKRLINSGTKEKQGKTTIIQVPKSRTACTFFNSILLGENLSKAEREQILEHELVHVEQKHSYDLMLFEFLRILLWFSPFVYRHQTQLSILHEYIADEKAVGKMEKKAYFEDLLNTAFGTRKISFTNPFFNKSLIKKRILMLQKQKSGQAAKWKYLLVVPLIASMLAFVACSEETPIPAEKENIMAKPSAPPKPPAPPVPPEGAYEEYLEMMEVINGMEITYEEYKQLRRVIGKQAFESQFVDYSQKITDSQIPFSTIEKAPVFPGCENFSSNEVMKTCMTKKIAEFVNDNFDTSIGKRLSLHGKVRIQVLFKIDQTGKVVDVKARATSYALQVEAERVVSMLPDMVPGEQDGKKVSVLYSLPIIFQVE